MVFNDGHINHGLGGNIRQGIIQANLNHGTGASKANDHTIIDRKLINPLPFNVGSIGAQVDHFPSIALATDLHMVSGDYGAIQHDIIVVCASNPYCGV